MLAMPLFSRLRRWTVGEPNMEEKELRLARVVSFFEGALSPDEARGPLERQNWDVEAVKEKMSLYMTARDGLLLPLSLRRDDLPFRGAENSGNSCYLDALLVAMFGNMDGFDASIAEKKGDLYTLLRVFVNQIRSGSLVDKATIDTLMDTLKVLGWYDQGSQEDASELLIFLLEVLDAPLLTTSERLHHGAVWEEDSDQKQVRDRMIMLGVDERSSSTDLEDLLRAEFHDGVVEDLRREVAVQRPHEEADVERRWALVNAWRTVSLQEAAPSVLPILLKRTGGSRSSVSIPKELDLSLLTNTTSAAESSSSLKLRSVVCHLGSSTECGHYITFLFEEDGSCRRWDDLQGMTTCSSSTEELSRNAYLLFYEGATTASASSPPSSLSPRPASSRSPSDAC